MERFRSAVHRHYYRWAVCDVTGVVLPRPPPGGAVLILGLYSFIHARTMAIVCDAIAWSRVAGRPVVLCRSGDRFVTWERG